MQIEGNSSSSTFFRTHAIFTTEEYAEFLRRHRSSKPQTRRNLLYYFQQRGTISRIRRGLYCSVPPGVNPNSCPIDNFLLASKLAPDAVLAYHTALDLHGRSYSTQNRFVYLTKKYPTGRLFHFRGASYQAVAPPTSVVRNGKLDLGVVSVERRGQTIRVTSLERTLVDVLDRPKIAGGWEEVWRSLEMIPYFDLDQVIEYTLALGKRKTTALVGFYLEQHRKDLMVNDDHLTRLERHKPRHAQYLSRKLPDQKVRLVPRWNFLVPEMILNRNWEELA